MATSWTTPLRIGATLLLLILAALIIAQVAPQPSRATPAAPIPPSTRTYREFLREDDRVAYEEQQFAKFEAQHQVMAAKIEELTTELHRHEADQSNNPAQLAIMQTQQAQMSKQQDWQLGILGAILAGAIVMLVKRVMEPSQTAIAERLSGVTQAQHRAVLDQIAELSDQVAKADIRKHGHEHGSSHEDSD
jgi:septal ring factor EnvC (AmiA/AmiB activator)